VDKQTDSDENRDVQLATFAKDTTESEMMKYYNGPV